MTDNQGSECNCDACGPKRDARVDASGTHTGSAIYLDHNATTPLDERVLEAMMPYLTSEYGNAASIHHAFGTRARAAVEKAREQVAALVGAAARDIVFTSGATESDNLAIKGAAEMYRAKGNHIITSLAEHKAVIDPCKRLAGAGYEVTWLKPDEHGVIHPDQVAAAITDKTILITIMLANNEVGTLNPIAEIAKLAKERGVLLHTDATQAVGKIPVDVEALGVDLMSLSAHKLYGPKGAGALYVRGRGPRVRLTCQMDGGGHERGLRSGTLNVPGIVGFGAACELAGREMPAESRRIAALRDRLERGITAGLDHVTLNGHPTERLPNTSNLSFAYVEGEGLMLRANDVAVSTGSACSSASLEPSHVLKAMGVPDELAHGSIRFSLGRRTTAEQVDYAVRRVIEAASYLRQMSPLYEMAQEGVDLSQVKWDSH
ncbi:MAG TPA: IscS subfamily cysteine desulfurase [Phycisphaerae bacterium]|nr:IscS subfamily cysteine desulfurase [Phycisphaerae bacterium]